MACLIDEFWFTFSTWVCLKAESGRFDSSHKRDAPFLTHFHARIFVHGVIDGFNYSLNHWQGCKLDFPRKRTASSTTILWLPYWYRHSLITHFRYAVMWVILNICVYLRMYIYIHIQYAVHHQGCPQRSNIKHKLMHSYIQMCCLILTLFVKLWNHQSQALITIISPHIQLNLWGSSRSLPLSHQQTSQSTCPVWNSRGAGCGLMVHTFPLWFWVHRLKY